MEESKTPILLIDGHCHLCHGSVRFVVAHERSPQLRFAALQSEVGRELLNEHGLDRESLHSVVWIDDHGARTRSDAALLVASLLRRPWSWLGVLRFVPRALRDVVYGLIARNRDRLFGRSTTCLVPRPGLENRFLDLDESGNAPR